MQEPGLCIVPDLCRIYDLVWWRCTTKHGKAFCETGIVIRHLAAFKLTRPLPVGNKKEGPGGDDVDTIASKNPPATGDAERGCKCIR